MSLSLTLRVPRWKPRYLCYRHSLSTSLTRPSTLSVQLPHQHRRHYASKNKVKSTATFIPGSKQPITNQVTREEYAKTEEAMSLAVDWFRKECAASEARALGRVTPALLSPVRVKVPGNAKNFQLEELATVGVREGTTLLITLFDEHVRFLRFISPFPQVCWYDGLTVVISRTSNMLRLRYTSLVFRVWYLIE